ncbi:aldehyde dehydrogenase family protein, partial [Methylobacterium ajmalii]
MPSVPIHRPFIAGRPAAEAGRRSFPAINPADGRVLAEVEHTTREDLEDAIEAARAGQAAWAA